MSEGDSDNNNNYNNRIGAELKMATGGGGSRSVKGPGSSSSSSSREETAKAIVADQISQAIMSTANLLHLMQQSSPSQNGEARPIMFTNAGQRGPFVQLTKLPKNLLAKTTVIKNTGQVLEQMPQVISSLDAHLENGLKSVPHLKTVSQLLENMENSQLNSLLQSHLYQKEPELAKQPRGVQ